MKEKNIEDKPKKFQLTRREFIKSSMLLTAGITFGACSDNSVNPIDDIIDSPQPPESIVIVGAGMAGLVAAYELTNAGFDVLILEGNDRVGGRIYTIREPFSNGQFAEGGAARIPSDHNHTLHYVDVFGLQLDPFYPREGNYLRYFGGERTQVSANNFLTNVPWPGSVVHGDYQKIRGGTDLLPKAFAEYLSDKISLNTPVEYIEQKEDRVIVRTSSGNEIEAVRVLVTVPLPVLNRIEFNPPLSEEKNEAANGGYNYAASSRGYVQFSQRFWESEKLNGWARTDYPEEIWQPTFDQPGNKGIVLTYLTGFRALQLDDFGATEVMNELVNRWDSIFPGAIDFAENGTTYSWVENRWSGGAYASPSEDQQQRYGEQIGAAEGRIHFAGEHISEFHGWIQGALVSGLRAVNEIKEAAVVV